MDKETLARFEQAVTRLEDLIARHADHESRLRSLEQYRWITAGVVALAMFLLAMAR